jgi:capsule polysaccharide export protein KpsE/RkpR
MSNMKLVSLIEHRAQQSHREAEAIAQDVYAALIAITDPLKARIEALEREIERQRQSITGVKPYEGNT